ncbi:MAG: acetyl-CoA carboxylase biotin carboxyl carrier protein [Alphaproteobacteria bacterium]
MTKIDPAIVRELAEILSDNDLTEIKIEEEGMKLRIAKDAPTVSAAPVVAAAPAAAPAPAAPAPAPAASAPAAEPAAPAAPAGDAVTAPMVGTVYLQAEPGAAPFVSVGDTVSEGQTLVIIEAMKTMNPITAPRAGKVAAITVNDSQPVEFGEPLIVLE